MFARLVAASVALAGLSSAADTWDRTHTFVAITSGNCEKNGYRYIKTKELCRHAGELLGFYNGRIDNKGPSETGNRPKYCGTWGEMKWIHFTSKTSGKINVPGWGMYDVRQNADNNSRMICQGNWGLRDSYHVVKKGNCPSAGFQYIKNRHQCIHAARQVGMEQFAATPSGNRPAYCGTWGYMKWLHFNTQTSGYIGNYKVLNGADTSNSQRAYVICVDRRGMDRSPIAAPGYSHLRGVTEEFKKFSPGVLIGAGLAVAAVIGGVCYCICQRKEAYSEINDPLYSA